ncbi:hypothetical protein [Flavobacterium sp. ov086]|uniref:hypothetical protein n=1 Tax=Flavobacterium sp. ov086 TaxID=1761785 RepID=UPI000B688419|nr:hypothetical protein [Flavobacterium sp. ov086]SNR45413.1 hypothetical protein SAMN04487979_106126 [Flavobacterium sp. ov086]
MAEKVEDWEKKQKDYLAVAIICLIIGTYFFMKVINGSYIIKPSDLSVYDNLITSEVPKFKETKGKHGRRWIEFKCVDNRSTFEIANFDYKCINDNEILNEIKAGDTISIAILKGDVEGFDNDTSCEIHSLIKNDKEYLDLQCRNKADNKDGKMGFLILFAISIMTAIVYSFSGKPKLFNKVNPEIIIGIIVLILFIILRIN